MHPAISHREQLDIIVSKTKERTGISFGNQEKHNALFSGEGINFNVLALLVLHRYLGQDVADVERRFLSLRLELFG